MNIKEIKENLATMSPEERAQAEVLLKALNISIVEKLQRTTTLKTTTKLTEYDEILIMECEICKSRSSKFLSYQPRVINGGHALVATHVTEVSSSAKKRKITTQYCAQCLAKVSQLPQATLATLVCTLIKGGKLDAKDITQFITP